MIEDRDDKTKHAAIRLRMLPRGTVKVRLVTMLLRLRSTDDDSFV